MATVVVQQQHTLRHTTPPPSSMPPALMVNRRSSPIPNKHLPVCPTGPSPAESPQPESPVHRSSHEQLSSILYPPYCYHVVSQPVGSKVFGINAQTLGEALDYQAAQSLPDASQMYPWLHGLHPDNHLQLGFFSSRKRVQRKPPKVWRGITLVKLGGDLSKSRIKGAVAPDEVISPMARFLMADPPEGFSVRNFQIQTAKMAPLSDIVIYGEDGTDRDELLALADEFAMAQAAWRLKHDPMQERKPYNTFVLTSSFSEFEERWPRFVSLDADGDPTGSCMDFFQWERLEMATMSCASEISENVFLGPTPDYIMRPGACNIPDKDPYDLIIEANDLASIPGPRTLATIDKKLETGSQRIEFPSSGSLVLPSGNTREVEDFVNTVRWIYYLAHPEPDEQMDHEGDIEMRSTKKPLSVYIHCADGYTESTLLAVAYFMFAEGVPIHEAWLKLHCEKKRNFFAYQTDVAFLSHIQTRLLQESPANKAIPRSNLSDPDWFLKIDGSLPSRILPYMYLGNLNHANNPELLWELGIRRVLSIGEPVSWSQVERKKWGEDSLMYIDNVQDNGIDPLCQEYDRCLKFIELGKNDGAATLVHCRVGVSRSASICIAEVMACMDMTFPRAYCFVRARRLNVIIQPHLRFVYELLQWEEFQSKKRQGLPRKRQLEWSTVCREIALLNKPYSRT
ncbi:Protein-tyrosine/Dual-specificity phosphatase [Penicillium angulare]|uniref:Protein-tyrosine/Dual-specificity phosphatase n=1 Tax=Penicillium angulare TaxID=116970 RepID=A0A9W9FV83_9EURO|nr:Protein-tyrosine/Dual-specificity phosphatase [Penicillium angulare]